MKDQAQFVEDISVKGMIHAVIIRSPVARGTLKVMEHPKLPNSYHLITAEHIPGKNQLADFPVPVLADRELSYIGEPVAILAGPEESRLEDFASQFKIIVDEESPVFSASEDPGGTIIERGIVSGDPEKTLSESKNQISGTYVTGIQEHWYSEAHGAVAFPCDSGQGSPPGDKKKAAPGQGPKESEALTIITATQWPVHVRRSAARLLGWDTERIKIETTLLEIHLDGKIWYPSLVACHAALAAWFTRSPVKLMLTQEEDFAYSPKRNRSEIGIKSALGEKGEILGSSIQVTLDLGARGIFEDEIMDHTCLGALGAYNHRDFLINGRGIRTNIPPQGPMAGFGLSQGFFAVERHVSKIADTLGQDPAEWRKNNFLGKEQKLPIGTALKNPMPLAELIDAAAQMSDYYRKWASYELLRSRRREKKWDFREEPLRGIGISTAYQGSGFLYNDEKGNGNCSVELTLEKDGSLEVKTNIAMSGAAYPDTWRELVKEILGVEPGMIRLNANSDRAPDSGPGTLSRNIGCLTRLVERGCAAIRKQRFRDPLPITVRRTARPGKAPGWVPGKNIDPDAFARPSWGAAVIETEIDPVSWVPQVRGIWLAVDGGKILSQRRARRTLSTGIIQALGWTCREQVHYEKGKIPGKLCRNYDIMAPAEIPPIHVDFIWNDTADPKGIGDLPFCCVPAAYVQAVSQAMDHHFESIPLNPRNIWDAVQLKQTEGAP